MKCPFCGTDNQPGDDFCSNCGGYLASPPATLAGDASHTMVSTVSPATNVGATTTGGGSGGARTLTPNARLENGRYVVEKILGEGGMGAAVLAKDSRVSNKPVVIKELLSDNADAAKLKEDVRNFELEVETLANLDHPLIPTVTDSFQEGSHYFMVQEYVAGENLESRMDRVNKPMPEQEALGYASQVLDILDYLAQQTPPIVHRDIKPANIIIGSKDKRAHLVDFGIARAEANKNVKRKQTSALGTPGYAPPEQYQGNADGRSDLYALAATLHHLLTNRDPRNYPPFTYPPVRSLNPQLSPDIERVLERALKINVNERYQNAAAMKHDIDEILMHRFSSSGDTSNYTLRTSGPITPPPQPPPPARPVAPSAASANQPRRMPQPASPAARAPYQQQAGMYAPPPAPAQQSNRGSFITRGPVLLFIAVILIAAVLFGYPLLTRSRTTTTGSGGNSGQPITPFASAPSGNAISVQKIGNELIGISDGTMALDTNRPDGALKTQAADKLKQGDAGSAVALWNQAVSQESNDAEALIYLENQRIANAPHITLVVGTMPSGDSSIVGVGRDDLHGAYVAQKEFNDGSNGSKLPGGLKVRLLIASSGAQAKNATLVAQQIVQLAKSDPTVVGVMGWPYSGLTYPVAQVLSQAHIPMVSPTASSDSLTGISPYFFRVAPSNKAEAIVDAKYAEEPLGAKNVAVFMDNADLYSQSLGQDFKDQFTADGKNVVATENYTRGQPNSIQPGVLDALNKNPDLIYFAGYPNDVSTLLTTLNTNGASPNLKVLGGDALYELGGYQGGFGDRLRFSAFSYPDEWDILAPSAKKPAFFTEYSAAFSGNNQHTGYGFTRQTNDDILSYDATVALLKAASTTGKTTITADDLKNALGQTKFQGVSGWIAFGSDGDPVDKAVVILYVDPTGHIKMEQTVEGKFLGP